MKIILLIKGMHCKSCKALIEDVCREIKGVASCVVGFESGRAEVQHDGSVSSDILKKKIEELDKEYKVEIIS